MSGRTDYEDRKQARIDRYLEKAQKAEQESEKQYNKSNEIASHIPFGQPILVGHHSESRARRDQDKIHNSMMKSIEAQDKANYYRDRAESAENSNSISSDDPQAIEKLEKKIENLKQLQIYMKKVNFYYRKNKTCKGCEDVSDEEAKKLDESMKTAYSWVTAPFAPYQLSNLNARIKDSEKRLSRLKEIDEMTSEIIKFDGGEIVSDADENRIKIIFDERPDEDMRTKLKRNGFKWAPSVKAWQRLRNRSALYAAKSVCEIEESIE